MKSLLTGWDWEDRWILLAWSAIASVLICTGIFLFSTKHTKQYSIGFGGVNNSSDVLTITKEIENWPDDEIKLDRSISYYEAIHIVDSLNKTIIKK